MFPICVCTTNTGELCLTCYAQILHARLLSCVSSLQFYSIVFANDPNVNVEETMGSACHSSLAATRAYVVRGNDSEAAKLSALGFQLQG